MNKKSIPGAIFLFIFLCLFMSSNTSFGVQVSLMELEEVTDLIMSPGCDYVYTLTNCPSGQADQMRELVKDRIRKGESTEEILSYFEDVYGPRILAQPSKKGFYFVAWWFPYFLMLDVFILAGVFLFLWRKKSRNEDTPLNDINPEIETLLEDEVRKFKKNE